MPNTTMTTSTHTQKPVHSVRVHNLEVSIWANHSDTQTFFSVTIQRSYQVESEGEMVWKRSASIGSDSLLNLRRALSSAETWIAEQPA